MYKVDAEGNLVEVKEGEELTQEEQKMNTTKLSNFGRTVVGVGADLVTETVDLGRLLVDTKLKYSALGKTKTAQEFKEKVYTKQDEALKTVFETVTGKDNVEMVQRGERFVPAIKQPESMKGEIVRDIVGLGTAIIGAGKVKWVADAPKKIKEGTSKFKKFITPSQRTKQAVVAGEVGTQVGFNPYEEGLIPEAIGSLISDDSEMLADVKQYLLQDRQENSNLKNRMLMLGDGLAFVGAIGAGGKIAGKSKTIQKGKDYTLAKLAKGKESFVTMLDDVKASGKETVDKFIYQLEKNIELNKYQTEALIKDRNKDIADGVVKATSTADIDALKPGFISKYVSDTNLMFTANPILRNFEIYRRKAFTTQGNKTLQLHEKYLKNENLKEKWNDTITNVAYNLDTAIESVLETSNKFKNKEELNDKISDVLFTDFRSPTLVTSKGGISVGKRQQPTFEKELKSFPKELQDPLRKARNLQDNLTKQMIDTGTLNEAQKKIYQDQMGFYVRRSYQLFEDPNYTPKTSVLREAEDFLTSKIELENPGMLPADVKSKVDTEIADILDVKKGTDFTRSTDKFGKIRKEILNGKENIPSPLRKLMGEIDDPTKSLIQSTIKLGNYVENVKFYDDAFEGGAGIYFKTDRTSLYSEVIPEGYGKLSGRATTPELFKYFSNHKTVSDSLLNFSLYRNLALLKGVSQAAKTVWSHTTHVKNVAGGVQMSLANGVNVFDIKQTKEIVGILRARTKNNVELQKLHEELSGLGLLNKGVVARDLKGLASDLQGIKSKSVLDVPANLAKGFLNKTGISKHAEKWQNAYIAEDDFFKVNMYFREKKNLEKINNMYSKESGLKLSEQQLKEEAAKMVRDVLPNYDLVPELLKELRSTPFFGRFFSFMAESTRISANSITNGIKEVSKGKALIKQGEQKAGQEFIKRGTLRLGAFTAMAGAGAKGAETVSKATTGIATDTLDAIKDLVLPDYMQNSNVILSVAPDGSPVVSNLSSWDAFDFPKKPFQVIINKYMAEDSLDEEGLLKDILTTTISETVSPFLGESIIQEQISNYVLRGGRTLDGNLMRNPFNRLSKFNDSGNYADNLLDGENITILMANLLESITPGSITRGQDLHKTLTNKQGKTPYDQDEYEAQAFLKFVTGWGMQPINPEYAAKMYEFKANDYLKSKRKAQSSITSAIGQELDRDTFVGEYLKRSNEHYESYIKFHKNTKSLEKLDIDVYSTIRNTNVSKKDRVAVMYGSNYEPIGLSDSLRAKMLDAAPDFDTYEEIYKDIMAIDREMSRIPVQISPLYYKKQKQQIKDIKKDLRENYKTGGKVPNVQEDPADRKNPVMQESYSQTSKGLTGLQKALQEATKMLQPKEQMERLGFSKGGSTLKKDEAMYLKFYKLAKEAGNDFPEAVAAQASLESGHGESELTTKYKNPLGIKVNRASERKAGQKSVKMSTQEFVEGLEGTYKEPFRVYDNLAESFVGYKEKVLAPRYDSIRQAKNSDEYLTAISTSGYATDPKYAEKTINIKNRYAHLIPQENKRKQKSAGGILKKVIKSSKDKNTIVLPYKLAQKQTFKKIETIGNNFNNKFVDIYNKKDFLLSKNKKVTDYLKKLSDEEIFYLNHYVSNDEPLKYLPKNDIYYTKLLDSLTPKDWKN
jgi:flagellum-specific peptidoglycan hydrolase FlgJ